MISCRPLRCGLAFVVVGGTALFASACASKPAPISITAEDAASSSAQFSAWKPPGTAYDESFGLNGPAAPVPPMDGSMQMDHGNMKMPMEQQAMPSDHDTAHGGHQ